MIDISAVFANYTGSGPLGYTGKNATGAGATDGTEFIAAMIDNWMWGWTQELFTKTGITPDGVTEAVGASQIVEAIQLLIAPPGTICEWNLNADPATFGARLLLLNGQGILRATYPDLDAKVYVGDPSNPTASEYYHADDAAGTIRNTAGVYLILPESRGYTVRGLDTAASVDPDGASRDLGHLQDHAFQSHAHGDGASVNKDDNTMGAGVSEVVRTTGGGVAQQIMNDGVGGTPQTSTETRMINRATKFAIRY